MRDFQSIQKFPIQVLSYSGDFFINAEMKNRIKEFRVIKGLSQEKLGSMLHTTKQTISRLEKGRLPLTQHWMERIAPLLGRQPHELITPEHEERIYAGERRSPRSLFQDTVNTMTATEEAAEIFKTIMTAPPDTQKILADWLKKIVSDAPENASRGETARPKKNN